MQALLNLSNKVNIINSAYAKKLGLHIRLTNIGAYKINRF